MNTYLRSFAFAAVAAMLSLATTAWSFPGWPSDLPDRPQMYRIDGYLDRMPEGVPSLDEIEVSADGTTRRLFVTEYGTPGYTGLDMHLSRNMASNYGLMGSEAERRRLIEAPEGSAVRGLFIAYTSGAPSLRIAELELPPVENPSDAR